tara:strand:- start:2009 stop:3256 length:1248 start_codon:yes stop_codon:yes gene_type:complete
MIKTLLSLVLVSTSLFAANTLHANTDSEGRLNEEYLTGNWHAQRATLEEEGYRYFAYYNTIASSNVSGGIDSGSDFAGDLFAGMQLDLDKIFGWEDWTFNLSGIERHGNSIDDHVGGIYSVMQLVGGQSSFLYGLSLEKTWANEKYAFKFGRITATDDFAGSPFYGYYLSNSINGQIRAVLFDGVMTSYPFAVWGARFQYTPSDNFRVRIGAYQLTEKMWNSEEHGTDFGSRGSDGLSLMTQLDWGWSWGGKPGHFSFGMNNVHFDMPNFNSDGVTENFIRYYVQLDQQITQETDASEQGLYLFGTLAYTDQEEAALVPMQSSFGAQYVGPFRGRAKDRLIFGTTYGDLSDDYADEQQAVGAGHPDYEWIFELGYRVQLTKYAYIQPDIQYVVQPGGTSDIDNATVVGVQLGVSF